MHHIHANMYQDLYLGLIGGSLQESKITNVKPLFRHEFFYASPHIKHLMKPSFMGHDKIAASKVLGFVSSISTEERRSTLPHTWPWKSPLRLYHHLELLPGFPKPH